MSLAKRARTTLHPRHQMKLDTIRGVVSEQARLYRLWTNNKIRSSELTRGVFALREIRISLESIPPDPPSSEPRVFNIVTIEPGTYIGNLDELSSATMHRMIEHRSNEEGQNSDFGPTNVSSSGSKISDCAQEIEPAPQEANPVPPPIIDEEPNSMRRRAKELGFELLPRRPAQVG